MFDAFCMQPVHAVLIGTPHAPAPAPMQVKEENDLYLRQLESEGRAEEVYGKGVQLIVPTESFVLKTRVVGVHPPASAQPKQQQEARDQMLRRKAFVNVCTSDKVAKFSLRSGVGENGRKGTYVEMPLSLGPQKQGTDKKGEPCLVWDFVVHPETVEAARSNPNILRVLADTVCCVVWICGFHGLAGMEMCRQLAMCFVCNPGDHDSDIGRGTLLTSMRYLHRGFGAEA